MAGNRTLRPTEKALIVGLYLLLQALDIFSTYLGLRRGAYEANLLPGWLLQHFGEIAMYMFKGILVVGVLFVVVRLQRHFPHVWLAVRLVNVMMVFVLLANLIAIA